MNPDHAPANQNSDSMTFNFDHSKEFTFPVTEEFVEHCAEGALSIEVWGHRSAGFTRSKPGWEVEQQQLAKARSLADRWSELSRKLELWVEIEELNDAGEYSSVEVAPTRDVLTGGVYQLRQGQQRRVRVKVTPVIQSGTLPIICQEITNIALGSVSSRSRLQKPLDSYQEDDLNRLREKWSEALLRRRNYLDQQIQRLINKQGKNERDCEREQSLVEQWVSLTEERNAVMVPAPGSGIPGAPADWTPPLGMEPHIPVLFLDLNADDLSANKWSGEDLELPVAGLHSILPKEHGKNFHSLPIVKHCEKEVCAISAWDSSVHNSDNLNKLTDGNERVYLILRTTVRLSHPAPMDVVLRKRLCLNIYKRQSITDRIRRKIVRSDGLSATGVTYEVVSNIPKASEELEERESLAQIAASGDDASLSDGESYIEKYTRGVSAVEGILTLDRLRQRVAVREMLQHKGVPLTMRKTCSVPNFSQLMRLDGSGDGVSRSESVSDLNKELRGELSRPRKSLPDASEVPSKQFAIASPNTKLGLRMTTLHEEHPQTFPIRDAGLIEEEEEEVEVGEEEPIRRFSEFEGYQAEAEKNKSQVKTSLPSSRTLDSLVELQSTKGGTPSTSSSGYGSQAVSSSNLTSDDCLSLRSMDTPEDGKSCPVDENKVSTPPPPPPKEDSNNQTDSHSGESETPSLPPGKVIRRRKSSSGNIRNNHNRASFPQARGQLSESKAALRLERKLNELTNGSDSISSSGGNTEDEIEAVKEVSLPDWVCLGESVQIRPYNSTGVIAYIGPASFAPGTWVGVDLDAPIGKNDGSVEGIRYFESKPKHGIFVRADKLIRDRRGRAMRDHRSSTSKSDSGNLHRSRSRGEGLSSVGKSASRVIGK